MAARKPRAAAVPDIRSEEEARRILDEVQRREAQARALAPENRLHPHQIAFKRDPAKRRVALCGRRAGKTYCLADLAHEAAARSPRSWVPYITLTRDQARRNFWPVLRKMSDDLKLGYDFNDHMLTATHPNGAKIFCVGTADSNSINLLRGAAFGYPRAILDEVQSMRSYVHELVEDVLDPATLDQDGDIIAAGTPGPVAAGYFYDITEGEHAHGWSSHRWTVLDNPYMPHAASWLAAKRLRQRWDDQHPTYLREWLGRWVKDSDSLMYRFAEDRNVVAAPPELDDTWQLVLGIDLGYGDSTAFVVLACQPELGMTYVLEVEKETGLIPSAVAVRVEQYQQRYAFERIVADSGGAGIGYVVEMRDRYGIPVEAASKPKHKKPGDVALINGELRSGTLMFVKGACDELLDEIRILQWDEKKKDADERYENHAADALLYGWRACRPWMYDPQELPPQPGTPEAVQRMADEIEANELRQLEARGRASWDSPDPGPEDVDVAWLDAR